MNRRGFLKLAALTPVALTAGAAEAAPGDGAAGERDDTGFKEKEFVGMLIDSVRCIGCQACEAACAEQNGLPYPEILELQPGERKALPLFYTPVSRYDTSKGKAYVKRACMNCNQPACASACLCRAMEKTVEGPVVWHSDRCMGCRYCMIACPFEVPKFEYDKAVPRIGKCTFCVERLRQGRPTACSEACPQGAVTFGSRRQLLAEARRRLAERPDLYTPYIYGDHDVGGTCVMHIAGAPFDEIGFRTDLGTRPYPEYTKEFLYSVPIIDVLLPVLLYGMSRVQRVTEEGEKP